MDSLWAPWRMEFIKAAKAEGCVFCEALGPGEPDRDRLVLHVGRLAAVVMNKYPYGHGHVLVMPRRHIAELTDLTREEDVELAELLKLCVVVLREALHAQGFNVGLNLGRAAGAGIESHLHWHLLPRWVGDTNFLALIGEVKSIPEHIAATFDHLRPLFAQRLG